MWASNGKCVFEENFLEKLSLHFLHFLCIGNFVLKGQVQIPICFSKIMMGTALTISKMVATEVEEEFSFLKFTRCSQMHIFAW